MQRPRHAGPQRGDRVRALMRGAVVAVLALPTVVGVAALLDERSGSGGAAAAAIDAGDVGPAGQVDPGASSSPAAPSLAAAAARSSSSAAARSAGRVAVPAPPATTGLAAGATATVSRVVGLGDSVPAGTNCGCTDYVQLLAQDLGHRQGTAVEGTNLAVPGLTSDGLLQQLGTDDVRQAVAAADVVVLTVGANDLESAGDPASCSLTGPDADAAAQACYQDELAALTPNLDRITAELAALPTSPGARVLVTGYWNVFLDGSAARTRGDTYVRVADGVTKAVNQRIAAAAVAHGAQYVDLFAPFRGSDGSRDASSLLADDGDHPNADGHRAIERALASAL